MRAEVKELLSKTERQRLMRRNNVPAVGYLSFHLTYLTATGYLAYLAIGTVFWLPASVLYGIGVVHLFSFQHECSHRTVFTVRWLNDLCGWLCGVIIQLPPVYFRWEHYDHHTHTQLVDKDPQLIAMPRSMFEYIWYLTSFPYWQGFIKTFIPHVLGIIGREEQAFIPVPERYKVIWEARAMLAIYAGVAALSVYFSSMIALYYWVIPRLIAEPLMRLIRMTEHVGCSTTKDIFRNTRTTKVCAPLRILAWNMPYHAEHHMVPSIPFHALPDLHRIVGGKILQVCSGYRDAHLMILRKISIEKNAGVL